MDAAQAAEEFRRFVRGYLLHSYAIDHDMSRDDAILGVGALLNEAWHDEIQPKLATVWYALPDDVRASEELQAAAADVMPLVAEKIQMSESLLALPKLSQTPTLPCRAMAT